MAKKQKNKLAETDQTNEIVKKVKSAFLETVVREWLNTPCKEFDKLTPLQMVKKGRGQELLDAIELTERELKSERMTKIEKVKENDTRSTEIENSVGETEQETILQRIEGS